MKKLPFLLILILVLSSITSVQAQLIKSIWLRTGWCSTNPNVTESKSGIQSPEKYYNLNLIYIEIQTEYLQRGNLSLLTNLSYIPKGYSYFSSAGGGYGFFPSSGSGRIMLSANTDYINLTVAPKLSFNLSRLTFYGFVGVQSGFLAEYDSGFNFPIYSHNPNSYNPDYVEELALNRITLGGTIGGGIATNRTNKRINYSLQAQYLHDFTKAADYNRSYNFNGNNYFYNLEMKYQTFLLGFGVHYTFKEKKL